MFNSKPKSYYGIFSIFFKAKLYSLFIIYFLLVLLISLAFSFNYEIIYVGPKESDPIYITYVEKWYFSIMTFMSPGFTEFIPANTYSRILATVNGLLGISFNALLLSILIARAILPHEPFEIVSFMLYDPRIKKLTLRFYSTLPSNCYNLNFRFFRFAIFQNKQFKQVGTTKEIVITPNYRNILLKNYGILLNIDIDFDENIQQASLNRKHLRKKIPIEWLIPEHKKYPEGHFYLTIEAESLQGKVFQTINFNSKDIKIGHHKLLNEGKTLTLGTWYNWEKYRWDLWGKFDNIPNIENYSNDLLIKRYKYNEKNIFKDRN